MNKFFPNMPLKIFGRKVTPHTLKDDGRVQPEPLGHNAYMFANGKKCFVRNGKILQRGGRCVLSLLAEHQLYG